MITPVIGFNTVHLASYIPQLWSQLTPLSQTNPARVVQTNPANFPFASFAPDSTWAINTQSAIDVEVACNLRTHATRVTHYRVCVDVVARWVGDAVGRVLITSMPPRITDASTRRFLVMCGIRFEHRLTLCRTMTSTAILTSWKISSSQRLRCETSNATSIGCGRMSTHRPMQ